jgi:N-acetylglucosaminyldiphosphoundecaprenol N-acetyl-beta-D-mannosaminyltransferase
VVLGIPVDAIQMPAVVERMSAWVRERGRCRYVAETGMHGVTEAQKSPAVKEALAGADLVVADGMPLVWLGRLRGFPMKRRVYGPELMLEFCGRTVGEGVRHYFYGGAEGVPERLAARLQERFPGLQVAGALSPPFRDLTPQEAEEICARINAARPDVLWVGMSTPKQELFMHRMAPRLEVPVMVGVGAAFDFHTGRVRQAPVWMRENGLEWLWRLGMEPRRLWRRYLVGGSRFVFGVTLELLGWRRWR